MMNVADGLTMMTTRLLMLKLTMGILMKFVELSAVWNMF
jgi:hypothetical protein